jgi:hypothetical protein
MFRSEILPLRRKRRLGRRRPVQGDPDMCDREFFRLGRPKGRYYGFDLGEGGGVGGSMLGRDNGDGEDDD